jgi:hypothetical protein
MKSKRAVHALVLMVSVGLLAGCTSAPTPVPSGTKSATPKPSSSASASPSATPSTSAEPTTPGSAVPTPKPDPVKTTVVQLGADELRLENLSGEVLGSFPYDTQDAPVAAIDALTKLYGKEPAKRYTGEQMCDYQTNVYTWDNLTLRFQAESQNASDSDYFSVSTNTVNQNMERVVQAPNGAQVGQPLAKFVKAFPSYAQAPTYEYEGVTYQTVIGEPSKKYSGQEHQDTAGETGIIPKGANINGTTVTAQDGTVKAINTPGSLIGDC